MSYESVLSTAVFAFGFAAGAAFGGLVRKDAAKHNLGRYDKANADLNAVRDALQTARAERDDIREKLTAAELLVVAAEEDADHYRRLATEYLLAGSKLHSAVQSALRK